MIFKDSFKELQFRNCENYDHNFTSNSSLWSNYFEHVLKLFTWCSVSKLQWKRSRPLLQRKNSPKLRYFTILLSIYYYNFLSSVVEQMISTIYLFWSLGGALHTSTGCLPLGLLCTKRGQSALMPAALQGHN